MSRVFAASSDQVLVTAAASINNLAAYTYAAWVKPHAMPPVTSAIAIAIKDPSASYIGPGLTTTSASPTVFGDGSLTSLVQAASNSVAGAVVEDAWQRVVMVYDNSGVVTGDRKCHLYVNGMEVASYQTETAATGTIQPDASGNLFIGNDSFGDNFFGKLAVVDLWSAALSAAQILADYAGTAELPGRLVCSLLFTADNGSTEPDASGNGNTGAITGATFSSDNPPLPASVVLQAAKIMSTDQTTIAPADAATLMGTLRTLGTSIR